MSEEIQWNEAGPDTDNTTVNVINLYFVTITVIPTVIATITTIAITATTGTSTTTDNNMNTCMNVTTIITLLPTGFILLVGVCQLLLTSTGAMDSVGTPCHPMSDGLVLPSSSSSSPPSLPLSLSSFSSCTWLTHSSTRQPLVPFFVWHVSSSSSLCVVVWSGLVYCLSLSLFPVICRVSRHAVQPRVLHQRHKIYHTPHPPTIHTHPPTTHTHTYTHHIHSPPTHTHPPHTPQPSTAHTHLHIHTPHPSTARTHLHTPPHRYWTSQI